jgi:hypothetical protein
LRKTEIKRAGSKNYLDQQDFTGMRPLGNQGIRDESLAEIEVKKEC